MTPKRVCFIAGTLARGGAEQQLYYLVKALASCSIDVLVICLNADEYWEGQLNNIGVRVIHAGRNSNRLGRLLEIWRIVRSEAPDIVHSAHFYTNLYAWAAAQGTGAICLAAVRNDMNSEVKANGPLLGRLSLLLPRWLAANSQKAVRRCVLAGRQLDDTFHLANAVDTDRFCPRGEYSSRSPITLLWSGRFVKQKRPDRFVWIMHDCLRRGLPVRGVIAGDGPLKHDVQRMASQFGLDGETLRFSGHLTCPEEFYRGGDIFVLTSDHEGMPNVVMEAMASGLPVVSTSVGGSVELIEDGVTGFLTDPADLAVASGRISELVDNEVLRQSMGKAGRDRMLRAFSLGRQTVALLALYGHILRKSAT